MNKTMNKTSKALALVLAFVMVMSVMVPVFASPSEDELADEGNVDRISGANRIATAIEVSKKAYPEGSDAVILASGFNNADALASGPLAIKKEAPILLTGTSLTDEVKAEIDRIAPEEIIIVGGTEWIPEEIASELDTDDRDVSRLSGANRYLTSIEIAKELEADKIILAEGNKPVDALTSTTYAVQNELAIVLTDSKVLPAEVEKFIADEDVKHVEIAGGTGAVSEDIENALGEAFVSRTEGANRFETAIEFAKKTHPEADSVVVVNSNETEGLVDAFSAAPYAYMIGAPILVTEASELNAAADEYLVELGIDVAVIIGGENSVGTVVEDRLEEITALIKDEEAAKVALDRIESDADLEAEFAAYQAEGKEKINNHVDEADYTVNADELAAAIEDGHEAVDEAETNLEVDSAVRAAWAVIDEILTDDEVEALAEAINEAINKIADLPAVEDLTLDDAEAVKAARALVDAVEELDEDAVVENIDVLEAAEARMAEFHEVVTVEDLTEAIQKAVEGDTLVLGADIELGGQLAINKTITLDGAGFSLNAGSPSAYAVKIDGGTATLENMDLNSAGGGVGVVGGAKGVFDGGSVAVNTTNTSGRYNFYVVGEGTELTIKSGDFTFSKTLNQKRAYIYAGAGTTVYVEGGNFGPASNRDGYTAGIRDDGGTVIITGGTFGFDPTKWVAEGYYAAKEGDVWTIKESK